MLFVWLCVSGVKTGSRCIIRLDELSFVVRLESNPLFVTNVDHRGLRFFSARDKWRCEMNAIHDAHWARRNSGFVSDRALN